MTCPPQQGPTDRGTGALTQAMVRVFIMLIWMLPAAIADQGINNIREELLRNIYGSAAYDPFVTFKSPPGLRKRASPHTHVGSGLIEHLLDITDAKLIVEVGAFIGGSTMLLAKAIEKRTLSGKAPGTLVTIDPFVGDVQMWFNLLGPPRAGRKFIMGPAYTNPAHDRFLFMQGGRPHIFEQFMVNILEDKMQHIVLPLVTTATVGLVGLQRLQSVRGTPQVDALYLDSSHEEDDTLAELKLAWNVLRPGGLLFGDDYDQYWPGVREAVFKFAKAKAADLAEQSHTDMQNIPPHNWTQIIPGLLVDNVHNKGNQWILFSRHRSRKLARRTHRDDGTTRPQ